MLTDTPLDLTPFGAVLDGIGTLYWLLVLAAIGIALWLPKHWLNKLFLVIAVIGVMVVPIALDVLEKREQQAQRTARLKNAMAHYAMRCKSAGEKIYKTVENVEGIFLMKVRPEPDHNERQPKQFKMNDPYGDDFNGESYIRSFLHGRSEKNGYVQLSRQGMGYRYVEAIDSKSGLRYRYTGYLKDPNHYELKKSVPILPGPRYGVTYDDISTIEDRKLWIAGSSLRVVDLVTNEVIAERIGYMIDQGQGSEADFRVPWNFAAYTACPTFPLIRPNEWYVRQVGQTANFVEKVLNPISQSEK
jgi:hypothetical protein